MEYSSYNTPKGRQRYLVSNMKTTRRSRDTGRRQLRAGDLVLGMVASAVAFAASLPSAYAGGAADSAQERVEAAIEACWASSEADRDSGVTSQMRHGTVDSGNCLEGVLQDEMGGLLADDTLARLDLPSQIAALRNSYESIFWELYNGAAGMQEGPAARCTSCFMSERIRHSWRT